MPGENVSLRFVENSNLERNKVLLYRAFLDVHNQLPAQSFSVSLNIMENSFREAVMDQYAFDITTGKISGLLNRSSAVALFNAAAGLGNEKALDALRTISKCHRLDRVRLAAFDALAKSASGSDEAIAVWAAVGRGDSAFLRGWRRLRTEELEALVRNSNRKA